MRFFEIDALLRSSVENVGGSAAVEEDAGLRDGDGVDAGVVSVVRKAPRRGFVRIRRGISSRMDEKVNLWLMRLKVSWIRAKLGNRQDSQTTATAYPWVLNLFAL